MLNGTEFGGIIGELWKELGNSLGFSYSIKPASKYGSKLDNGSWNGMVGMVQMKEVDMAICDCTVTLERSKVVSFTSPIQTSRYLLEEKSNSQNNLRH